MRPSTRLGRLIGEEWHSDAGLVKRLRAERLVRAWVADADLFAAIQRARDEHACLSPVFQDFNAPDERARVFLAPWLSRKGREWALPRGSRGD